MAMTNTATRLSHERVRQEQEAFYASALAGSARSALRALAGATADVPTLHRDWTHDLCDAVARAIQSDMGGITSVIGLGASADGRGADDFGARYWTSLRRRLPEADLAVRAARRQLRDTDRPRMAALSEQYARELDDAASRTAGV